MGESLLAGPFEEVKYLVADMAAAVKKPLEEFDAYDRSEGYVSSLAIPLITNVLSVCIVLYMHTIMESFVVRNFMWSISKDNVDVVEN